MSELTYDYMENFIYNTLLADKPLEEQLKLYQNSADQYEKMCDVSLYNFHKILANEFSSLALPRDSRILDVGAGTGLFGRMLHKLGFTNIDALDACDEMLQCAKESNSNYKNYIVAEVSKAKLLPVDENTYDVALMAGSASPAHIDVEAYLQIMRVVKPGGIIGWIIEDAETCVKCNTKFQNEAYQKTLEKFVLQNLWLPVDGYNPKRVPNALLNRPGDVYFYK
ncbi:malonyl-[acyl-carrier protein] O-methyltransferase-like protein, partial [Dinothrombium tinctorium]